MKIELVGSCEALYFSLTKNIMTYYDDSEHISEMFGLNIDEYNKILIEKVIQHDHYRIEENFNNILYKDVTFKKNGICDTIYLERFKEVFSKELVLLQLGG